METIIKPYVLVFSLGALACASSYAQTNVQIYGSVDEGVDYISNVRGEHQMAVNSGKRSPDRIGFRGTEDLGDGMSAFFKLETGLNSDTGAQANPTKIFNRYATVGLSDRRLGTLTLGRMPDFAYDYVGPLNNSVPGISWSYSPGNLDNLANVYGIDNAVRYETPEFSGLQLGVMNGFGEDPTNFSTNRQYSFGLRYNDNDLRVGASYSMFHNRTADLKAAFGVLNVLGQNLTSSVFNTTRFSTTVIGASYRVASIFVPHATWTQITLENNRGQVEQRNFEAGVNIDVSGGDKTRFLGVSGAHSTFMDRKYNQLNLFITQYMSVSTQIYAGMAYVRASGPGAVAGAFGYQPSSGPSQVLARTGVQVQF
ncbi:porin [Undibacterium sp.]|uniref:porin n=1 Tax=Undibacterium sp. TaxID=1914977 RepID=UPI00374DC4C1